MHLCRFRGILRPRKRRTSDRHSPLHRSSRLPGDRNRDSVDSGSGNRNRCPVHGGVPSDRDGRPDHDRAGGWRLVGHHTDNYPLHYSHFRQPLLWSDDLDDTQLDPVVRGILLALQLFLLGGFPVVLACIFRPLVISELFSVHCWRTEPRRQRLGIPRRRSSDPPSIDEASRSLGGSARVVCLCLFPLVHTPYI